MPVLSIETSGSLVPTARPPAKPTSLRSPDYRNGRTLTREVDMRFLPVILKAEVSMLGTGAPVGFVDRKSVV